MKRLLCGCGHDRAVHEHFTSSDHCGLCLCRRYRVSLRRRIRAVVGR